jgi:hypothetical protein
MKMFNVCCFLIADPLGSAELVLLAHTTDQDYAFEQRDMLENRYKTEEPKREFIVITIQ